MAEESPPRSLAFADALARPAHKFTKRLFLTHTLHAMTGTQEDARPEIQGVAGTAHHPSPTMVIPSFISSTPRQGSCRKDCSRNRLLARLLARLCSAAQAGLALPLFLHVRQSLRQNLGSRWSTTPQGGCIRAAVGDARCYEWHDTGVPPQPREVRRLVKRHCNAC
eukprot:345483-Chlamydomonas_euryale.AAC.9